MLKVLNYIWDSIRVVYVVGFVSTFSLVIYANFPPNIYDPLECAWILTWATVLAMFWPFVVYFIYMITTHH